MGNWYDATIKSDANGYTSNLLKHRLTTRLRRSPKQSWFLQGVRPWCGTDDLHGHRGWELYCFANDLSRLYFNNSGLVKLAVKRLT